MVETCRHLKQPVLSSFSEDGMRKDDEEFASMSDAVKSIEHHMVKDMHWKMRAITLLQMVGIEGADQEKLAKVCHEHAEKGFS